jgi:hypothetical protein
VNVATVAKAVNNPRTTIHAYFAPGYSFQKIEKGIEFKIRR